MIIILYYSILPWVKNIMMAEWNRQDLCKAQIQDVISLFSPGRRCTGYGSQPLTYSRVYLAEVQGGKRKNVLFIKRVIRQIYYIILFSCDYPRLTTTDDHQGCMVNILFCYRHLKSLLVKIQLHTTYFLGLMKSENKQINNLILIKKNLGGKGIC